ncbi:MAG: hypothetical protein ACHRHE_13570 [Tepidisphaerales bacterium]
MSKSKLTSSVAFLFVCLVFPLIGWGGSAGTTVTLNAQVDSFTEWDATTHLIDTTDWSAGSITSSLPITSKLPVATYALYTNQTVTLTPTGGTNSGVLTNGTQHLKTEYMLTGTGLALADVDYKVAGAGAGQFFNANTYTVTHSAGVGSYQVILNARASSPAGAVDSGTYSCTVVLTASW